MVQVFIDQKIKFEKTLNKTNFFFSLYNQGLVIRIANQSYETDFGQSGIRVIPGYHTDIALDRSFKFVLPKPYSNCEIDATSSSHSLSDASLFNLLAHSNYEYTQQSCFTLCYQRKVITTCGCFAPTFLSLYENASSCDTFESMICAWNIFLNVSDEKLAKYCVSQCPLDCNRTELEIFL